MTSPHPRSAKRHAPLLIILALAACGGSGASDMAVSVVGTSGTRTPDPVPTAIATSSPTPMPMPTPTASGVSSPSLSGLAPVASGVDVEANLVKSWGTGALASPEEGGEEGAFRFLCAPSHNAYDDPIVYPGQPGKAHLHTFFGNTRADASSTYTSLRTTGDSSCNNLLNRSAYWMPAMIHPSGKVVMPDWLQVYYKRIASTNPGCQQVAKACLPLPRGLRYVFGYNMSDPSNSDPSEMRWWNCDGAGAPGGHFATIREAAVGCPKGGRIGGIVVAPNCWNGTELDSADHRSHMAWPQQNGNGAAVCPKTHPYLVPQFQLQAWYTNDGTATEWHLSSDAMPGMAATPGGTSLHADWFGAWEDSILTLWETKCINELRSCSGGDLGNGQQLKMVAGYDFTNVTTLVDLPARP